MQCEIEQRAFILGNYLLFTLYAFMKPLNLYNIQIHHYSIICGKKKLQKNIIEIFKQ